MNLSIAIVGFPNVGKSTLFNALLKKQQALAANYPFATIEPNIGVVPVPDERLEKLAEIIAREKVSDIPQSSTPVFANASQAGSSLRSSAPPPIKPATVEFVDVAGLVKGAAQGAGLGNKFLSHIRETQIIAHVVRAFTDENVIREGSSDPESDYAAIQTELLLADLQTISKSKDKTKSATLSKIEENLNAGIPAREIRFEKEEEEIVRDLHLLTSKPEIVVLNVSEDDESLINQEILKTRYANLLQVSQRRIIVVCAKVEEDLSSLSEEDQKTYLKEIGLVHSGLENLIAKSYETLGLISFLTAGEKEVRAWTIRKGSTAVDAAGVIHTDFSKKFIKAEVVSYDDFISNNGWKGARSSGRARLEGRDYIMQDGDVVEFKIGN